MGAVSTPQQSFYVFEIHSSMLAYCNWEAGAQKDSPPITGRIFLLRNLTRSTTFHNLANYYSGAYPDSLMNYWRNQQSEGSEFTGSTEMVG